MDGIISIYKEQGYTSFDVVAKLRGICHQKKIGHTGTLDPDATGVLPVCLGNATKLCEMLTDKSKEYEAVMLLGIETDTQDISGKVLKEAAVDVSEDEVIACIESFVGDIMQVPPMYSALKVNGKKLYELARAGVEVERKPRPVTIHSIDIVDVKLPRVTMRVRVSKGTYIRTLCNDIGQKLGCGAAMESLVRTRVGIFDIDSSVKLDVVDGWAHSDSDSVENHILKLEDILAQYDKVILKGLADNYINNGNPFYAEDINLREKRTIASEEALFDECENRVRVYNSDNVFKGLYDLDISSGIYKPYKMFLG